MSVRTAAGRRDRQVLVMGGGLAGLAAAIAAARDDREVVLCESAALGRDKVCGEFLSPEVAEDLAALGCADWIDVLAPAPVRTVLLASAGGARLTLTLPGPPGYCCTRRGLEGFLADKARAAGAVLHERAPIQQLAPASGRWIWRAGSRSGVACVAIGAFGKRSTLDAALDLPRARAPEQYAAVKAYLAPAEGALEADVELHVVPGGYVGLNAVEDGRVGLCALLDGAPTTDWSELSERFGRSKLLRDRLDRLGAPVGPIRGLARFGFGGQRLVHRDGGSTALLTGDAARMMPSFTGDGMAVALRSGRLAAAALQKGDPGDAYQRSYHREFDRRLTLANLLHRVFFRPAVFGAVAPLLAQTPRTLQRLYDWTRGTAHQQAA